MTNGTGRYVRVLTHGKPLEDIEDIEDDIVRAVGEGARVLLSTTDGLSGLETVSDSRNASIAEWAEKLSKEHSLDWRRVGRDVLFTALE